VEAVVRGCVRFRGKGPCVGGPGPRPLYTEPDLEHRLETWARAAYMKLRRPAPAEAGGRGNAACFGARIGVLGVVSMPVSAGERWGSAWNPADMLARLRR